MSLKLQVSLIYKEQELHTECQDGGEHRSVCAVAGWGMCQQCLSHHWDPALASTWKDGQHRHLCSLQRGPSHPKDSEELFLLYFQVHCWGKASSITLEWTFLLSTASFCLGCTFACSLPSSGFSKRRLCMSAAFWSSPVPSIQLKYTQEEKLIPCLSARKDPPSKYLSTPQLRFFLGKEVTMFCKFHQYQWPPCLYEHVQKIPQGKHVLISHPKPKVYIKAQPHQHRCYLLFKESYCKRLIIILLCTEHCHNVSQELFFLFHVTPAAALCFQLT